MTKNIQARLILLALVLCAAAPAQAQISLRAAGAQIAGTGASITPVLPAGTQAGDVAVLIIAGRPTNTTQPAAPAGWTLRSSSLREVGANDLKIMTFYRVLTGGDANPAVSLPSAWQGTSAGMSGQIAVWSGVHTTTPFDAADVTGNATMATTWTPPAITTVTAGAWVVSAVATSDDNALTIMTAQGFTGRMMGAGYDSTTGGDHAVGLADKVQATPGTATLLTWRQSVNASDRWAGITFALRPVPANTPPTVSLTSPAGGATFTAPANITLTATAADTDGTITKVEFFHGGTNLIATVTSAPYTFNWTNVAAASYSLTAKATDNLTASTTSAPVNITVNTGVAQLHYIHTDHLNTPRAITNQAQQVVWRWDQTDPFGGNVANDNPSGLGTFTYNLRFPGQYFDKETNLHYNYYRDYDPAIGRYIQSDPIGLEGGVNTYGYVGGNPLSRVDPFGLCAPDDLICQAAVGQTEIPAPRNPCDQRCFEDVLGISTAAAAGVALSGTPTIPKRFVTPGSSPATSVASQTASSIFGNAQLPVRVPAPTAANPGAMTKSVARAAGRWVPIAGFGVLSYDFYQLVQCLRQCNTPYCDAGYR